MSRINCHSAFRHYEMFHGHGACGGGSYGSIFNTTYNINCGGHRGGFWGGFGLGLGNFVGNLFGGFMGNMGFGGFGFPGFGFGGGMGFGFPSFGGFGGGNWFDSGNSSRVSNSHSSNTTTCNCKCCGNDNDKTKEVVKDDPDCAKIATITNKLKSLPEDADEKAIQGIIEDIDKAIEELDENNKKSQEETLKNLRADLETRKGKLNKDNTQAPVAATTPAPAVVPSPAIAATPTTVQAPVQPQDPVEENLADKINGSSDMNDLLGALPDSDYSKLPPTDKAAFDKKFGDLLKNMSEDNRFALLNNPKLPAALRAKVKQSFYKAGYTNYDGQTELKDGDVILAHDESGKTRDTKQATGKAVSTITKSSAGNHPQTIVIHDTKDITYTYKETIDGEYIYTSDQDHQEYVLQKNSTGKYDLMQYKYHKGFGTKDWS